MQKFARSGPVRADRHYLIPPLERVDREEILTLIADEEYFVLHAPRQTGKTTILLALRNLLNSGALGPLRCVYASLEAGRTAGDDVRAATGDILRQLAGEARNIGDGSLEAIWRDEMHSGSPGTALRWALARWSAADPRPLVLLLDEVDSLTGRPLLSLLSQLRSGYTDRPGRFPQSVLLCGLRDVRDYRAPGVQGSPFNIKAKSLRLGDFGEAETRALLGQHTDSTGQVFQEGALATVWRETFGQPWLVNALGHETCFATRAGRNRARAVSAEDVLAARERIIERRETHLENLAARLEEEPVRRVVGPILSGDEGDAISDEDLKYVRDLGLVAVDDPIRLANPIYSEVVPRVVAARAQRAMRQQTAWYVLPDGDLDIKKLLGAFQAFFRENSEHWVERFGSFEAGPQLLLHSFLHRVVNGGGWIHREQPLGAGRADLLIVWPDPNGGKTRRFVVECKLARGSLDRTVAEGLRQTARYMDRCGAGSGHLVVFDLDAGKTWEQKVFRRETEAEGKRIGVWGM